MLSFLTEMEIYALLGNALDNALEGMEHVESPEKRFITLKAAKRDEIVILVIENYLEGDLTFVDGLPVTTKPDGEQHGVGRRSIRESAGEHGGVISVQTEPGLFRLTVTMEGR
ncbi:MAG: ATP-binding protein [Lachnospiraceae bacterium]|nr:ATP-binding protein [Lachnospiraceae bacterium]